MTDTPLDIGVLGYRFMRNHLFPARVSAVRSPLAAKTWAKKAAREPVARSRYGV